ncbi:MAG: hypothetical protein FJ146_03085 [Deltaproteobacteria bacterium]|nr:hypothetical protein [Deltaproteobacteria bacterium]
MGQLPVKVDGKRSGLRLFAVDTHTGRLVWRSIPLQLDPVDDHGRVVFTNENISLTDDVSDQDLLTFRAEDFGTKLTRGSKARPCKSRQFFELRHVRQESFAYLAICEGESKADLRDTGMVVFDDSQHQLQSKRYIYKFNSSNHMLFDSIKFRREDGIWEDIATDSRMLITADTKNFFTLHFDSRHIKSKLEEKRIGPVSSLARLSFFLKVLFLKIKMSLATDVGFFADSGHIPMLLNLPVDAGTYLNQGSGILYSWMLAPAVQRSHKDIRMPRLDSELIKRGKKNLSEVGLKFCRGSSCLYRYNVNLMGQLLAMDIGIERRLVEKGFFPFYVDDVHAARDSMNWDGEGADTPGRSGMYFEVSGLSKGEHPWDFWLRLGAPVNQGETCPEAITVQGL